MRIIHNGPKSVTVVSDDGKRETRIDFLTTAMMSHNKNGSLTVWGDGRPATETVRFYPDGYPVTVVRRKRRFGQ